MINKVALRACLKYRNMKKASARFIRAMLKLTVLVLALLFMVITIKTMRFSTKQIQVVAMAEVAIDKKAVSRLSAAVQLPTISYSDRIDTSAFEQLNVLIKESFP